MPGADVILGIHAVDGTGAAAADDNLFRIYVVLIGMFDEPGGGCVEVLHADVDGILESIITLRRRDERFPVPAAGRSQPVVYGYAHPAFLTKVVVQGVAKGVNPGTHGPGAAEGIDEHRTLSGRLVLELIDVHEDGLSVADNKLYGGPVGLGHNLLLHPGLGCRSEGKGQE